MVTTTKTPAKVYALFAAVFVLGAAAGGGLGYGVAVRGYNELASDESGEVRERRVLGALGRQLKLSDDQRERIRGIVQSHHGERGRLARAMYEQCGDPLRDQKAKMDAEIRGVLRPDQQQRFDEILKRQHDRFPFGRR